MLNIKLWLTKRMVKRTANNRKEEVLKMPSDNGTSIIIVKFIVRATLMIFFGGMILFPFFIMIMTALMPFAQMPHPENGHSNPPGVFPDSFEWGNFSEAFADGYSFALVNTLLVVSLSIALQILVSMLMGYGLAFKKYWLKKPLWYFFLSLLMLPQIALIVGQYTMVVNLGIQTGMGSILAMVLPYAASVFSAYMFKNAFESIPTRTQEAALLDGVADFKYFWKIAMPIATPTIWTVGILTAFASWNAYMWPALLAVGSNEFRTVLGIWLFSTGRFELPDGSETVVTNLRMAAAIISMLPLITVYFGFRRKIMDAVAKRGSAIKG